MDYLNSLWLRGQTHFISLLSITQNVVQLSATHDNYSIYDQQRPAMTILQHLNGQHESFSASFVFQAYFQVFFLPVFSWLWLL